MRDFSLDIYRELLEGLQRQGYKFISCAEYFKNGDWRLERFVILRHDIDERSENALPIAQIEHALGIKATYYFRAPEMTSEREKALKSEQLGEIIRAVVRLGHEIGYHYEDLSICKGDTAKAYAHFETYLAYFRQYYPVETICMHGSPRSKYDNRALWKVYNYKALGIIGEPYMDTDFSDVLYLTDTGRCWDGYKVSVRDKIPQYQDEWRRKGWTWHTTAQLMEAVEQGRTPARMMLTTHPQRWTNDKRLWAKEFISQKVKNLAKRMMLMMK